MKPDSYLLRTVASGGLRFTVVAGGDERGVLYGAFALLRKIAMAQDVAKLDEHHSPDAPVRWINQWDNLDGSIERGYGGRSIFWENGHVRDDLTRVSDYGRLLASSASTRAPSTTSTRTSGCCPPSSFRRLRASRRRFGRGACASQCRSTSAAHSPGRARHFDPLDPRVPIGGKRAPTTLPRCSGPGGIRPEGRFRRPGRSFRYGEPMPTPRTWWRGR